MISSNPTTPPTSASLPGKDCKIEPYELNFISVVHCLDLYTGFISRATINLVFSLTPQSKASNIPNRSSLHERVLLRHVSWYKIAGCSKKNVSPHGYTVPSSWIESKPIPQNVKHNISVSGVSLIKFSGQSTLSS